MAPAPAAGGRFGPIGLPEPADSPLTKTKDWLTRPAEKIAEWTGRDNYTFGDLTKAAMRRLANSTEPPQPPHLTVTDAQPRESPNAEELSLWQAWLRGRECDAVTSDGASTVEASRIRAWLRRGNPSGEPTSNEEGGWRSWLRGKAAEPDGELQTANRSEAGAP